MRDRRDEKKFDCIIVGGGHAGAEAAHAAARLGAKSLLVTLSKDTIGKMSCNPAIGGLAKGQIAREVDALGGLMGEAADATGIQFRLLNRSKGPAVQSPRAQVDKYKYKDYIRQRLEERPGLSIAEKMATEIIAEDGKVRGVKCGDGVVYDAPVVILTTGTFLRGLMHIGAEQQAGGRLGEPGCNELSDSLRRLGLELGRLKTGTPVRLDATTIDYDKVKEQLGDEEPAAFSFMTEKIRRRQIPCWITYTNEQVHELIRNNLHRAPLYTGQIKSVGPRYCPSIENKVVRFVDKKRHQIFLEPEDEEISSIYCNGISTSVPKDVQQQMLRLVPGMEKARIVHWGYAIEYDFCPPIQLRVSLETKKITGLFLAGQINGTSGYEEAAGQGIMAGINAVRKLQGAEPVVLGRDEAYIGVLIDDLLTKGVDEPYRMFTSRAEYRLLLRSDNADRRLTPVGRSVGLVDDERWSRFEKKLKGIEELGEYLKNTRAGGQSLWQQLKRPHNKLMSEWVDGWMSEGINPSAKGGRICALAHLREVIEAAVIDAKYEGYLAKQAKLVADFRSLESKKIPVDLDIEKIAHLRVEAKEKLSAFRPYTLGQASRISGITPADIMVIQIYLKKSG